METKRKLVWLTIFTFILSLSSAGHSLSAKTIRLSLSHFYPVTSFQNTKMHKEWVAEVEKATNGEVKIDIFPGGTLLKPNETYDGVVSGTADIGNGVFAYTRGRFPVLEGFEMAGINFGSCAATTMVAVDGLKKFNPEELSSTKLMYIYSVGPGSLYSKKKVTSLTDLKDLRIRATGLTAKSIEALGATPVAMPMNDSYESLSKGVIDGNIGPPEILKTWKQAEVTKYITILPPVYNSLQYVVMNKEKWDSLPEKIQKAIEKVNADFSLKAALIWDSEMVVGVKYGMEQGMEIVRLSESDNEKALALMQPLLSEYVGRMNEKGLPGQEIIDFVKAKAAIYSKQYPAGY